MTSVAPLQSSERLFILDAIRGVALCGILILNIYFFGRPENAQYNLNVYHETELGNIQFWYLTNYIVEGSFRALFSMLFGAGCILLVTRLQKSDGGLGPADVYYTRLIWLLVFGLINCFVLLWPGDILYSYAVCGLFIFPFRKSSVRVLLLMVAFFLAIMIFKTYLKNQDRLAMRTNGLEAVALEEQKKTITDEQKSAASAWKDYVDKHKTESLRKESEKEIADLRKSYTHIWSHFLEFNKKIESTIFYEYLFFDVMIFVFLGMALFKMGILTGERPTYVYGLFVLIGYPLGIISGIMEGNAYRLAGYDFFDYLNINPFPADLYQLHRICMSLGHLGVIVLLWKSGWFGWLLKPFANLGQMAFSNYLMQSVICTLFFYGYGLAYFGRLQRYELWYVVISVWIFQLIFSSVWLIYFRFGPLEWIWRSLTYWKMQPMRK
jgi:uncharacterized protein